MEAWNSKIIQNILYLKNSREIKKELIRRRSKVKNIIQVLSLVIILLFATGCSVNNDDRDEETTKLILETGFKDYVWDMSPEKVISMEYDDMTYVSDTINLDQDPHITYEYNDGRYVYDLYFEFENNRIKEICFRPQNVDLFEFYKFKKKQFDGKYGKVEEDIYYLPEECRTVNYYANTYQIELRWYEATDASSGYAGITYTEHEI